MDDFRLALVTGAARRLGRNFALKLGRLGYGIILHYNKSEVDALETAEEIRSLNVPVYPIKADLSDTVQIEAIFSLIDSLKYKMKVLVNSAAKMSHTDIRNISAKDWDATMNLNLRAPFLLAQKAAKRMTDGGLIVNVSDVGAGKAWTGYSTYTISKAGLDSMTRILARAYAPKIRVNGIAPSLVLPSKDISPDEWERLVHRLPLKNPISLDEISEALEYLLKNESVTGQTLVLDSGYSLT
jgi:pteridine reductase